MLLNGVEHDGLFIKMSPMLSPIMSPIKELSPLGRQIKTVRKKIRLEMNPNLDSKMNPKIVCVVGKN